MLYMYIYTYIYSGHTDIRHGSYHVNGVSNNSPGRICELSGNSDVPYARLQIFTIIN